MACIVSVDYPISGESLVLRLYSGAGELVNGPSGTPMTEPDAVTWSGYYEAPIPLAISGEFASDVYIGDVKVVIGFVTVRNDGGTYGINDPTPPAPPATQPITDLSDLPVTGLPSADQIRTLVTTIQVELYNRVILKKQPKEYEELGAVGFRIVHMSIQELLAWKNDLMNMLKDPEFNPDLQIFLSEWDNPRNKCCRTQM